MRTRSRDITASFRIDDRPLRIEDRGWRMEIEDRLVSPSPPLPFRWMVAMIYDAREGAALTRETDADYIMGPRVEPS
jgi:hypothetical protein